MANLNEYTPTPEGYVPKAGDVVLVEVEFEKNRGGKIQSTMKTDFSLHTYKSIKAIKIKPIEVGCRVKWCDATAAVVFTVVAISGDTAWIRTTNSPMTGNSVNCPRDELVYLESLELVNG